MAFCIDLTVEKWCLVSSLVAVLILVVTVGFIIPSKPGILVRVLTPCVTSGLIYFGRASSTFIDS